MYDDGFENMTNIDFSKACRASSPGSTLGRDRRPQHETLRLLAPAQVCIMEMMGKHLRTRPKMKWLVMDALAMKARGRASNDSSSQRRHRRHRRLLTHLTNSSADLVLSRL